MNFIKFHQIYQFYEMNLLSGDDEIFASSMLLNNGNSRIRANFRLTRQGLNAFSPLTVHHSTNGRNCFRTSQN